MITQRRSLLCVPSQGIHSLKPDVGMSSLAEPTLQPLTLCLFVVTEHGNYC